MQKLGKGIVIMAGQVHDLLTPRFLPMLIPPLPWRSPDSGGHLITRDNITRSHKFQEGHLQRKALQIAQERSPHGLSRVGPPRHITPDFAKSNECR